MWEHGLLVHVPQGVVLERPIYIRIANAVDGGSSAPVIVAEAQSRFSVIEEYASTGPQSAGLFQRSGRDRRGKRRQGRVRLDPEPLPANLAFRIASARVERDAELDWVAGGFGSRKGKVWIENDLTGPGATSRVTGAYFADHEQRLDYDTFQEHLPRTRRPTSRSRARCVIPATRSGAG